MKRLMHCCTACLPYIHVNICNYIYIYIYVHMGVYYLGGGLLFIQCIYVCRRISLLRVHVICVGLYAALCTFRFSME